MDPEVGTALSDSWQDGRLTRGGGQRGSQAAVGRFRRHQGRAAVVGCSSRRRSAGRLLRRQRWLATPDWSRSPPTWTPRPTRWWGWRREPLRAAGEFPAPLAVVQQPFEEAPPPRRSGTPLVTLPATAATPESRRASAGRTGRPVCRGRGPRCGVPAESAAGWTVGVPTTARRRRGPGGGSQQGLSDGKARRCGRAGREHPHDERWRQSGGALVGWHRWSPPPPLLGEPAG